MHDPIVKIIDLPIYVSEQSMRSSDKPEIMGSTVSISASQEESPHFIPGTWRY
jgi:hypothetical protein